MKSIRTVLLYVATVVTFSGCQCLPVTERCADGVDRIADHQGCMGHFHNPYLDVTRWGMWDGPNCCRPVCRR